MTMDDLDMLGAEYVGADTLEDAIAAGNRDVDALSDIEFNHRHPERGGAKIQKGNTELSREWLSIRDNVVRPRLGKEVASAQQMTQPSQSAARTPGDAGPISPETPPESTIRRNQIIAGSLGALALLGVGIAVSRY